MAYGDRNSEKGIDFQNATGYYFSEMDTKSNPFSVQVRDLRMPMPLQMPAHVSEIAGERTPAAARPAGYAALVAAFGLQVPAPDMLLAIGAKHTMRQEGRWRILTPRYQPGDTISAHLDFALRHEGVDLGILNALFTVMPKGTIEEWVRSEPTGQHARRVWFFYEWLTGQKLALPDAPKAPYVGALDEKHQFAVRGETVTRYRIRNNLPGTSDFCPLIRRTDHLTAITGTALADEARRVVQRIAPDLLARAAAFLLLEDSKASYVIEGERPPQDRIQRWGQAIGEAGQHPLTTDELLRLQRIVIGKARFMHFGWRTEGGFVGKRDRETNAPIPDHISARHEDIARLIDGLIAYAERVERDGFDPVVAAAAVAFGFIFIHPFEDGNGRIHRWLVHHILSRSGFNPPGMIFPVSAVFLEQIERYKEVLEHYSHPRLLLTQWETTPSLNVRVLEQTLDLFRFFDATSQAEFLADSVVQTIRNTLPNEVEYLRRYDQAKQRIGAFIDMPDATFDLMMGFLSQNRGHFSQRARSKEFVEMTDEEAAAIESIYQDLLQDRDKATSG